ncbi:hypothetical protein CC1G_14427 [Coprinopsis cinerea okayama7|uniref:Uncharacterized protein n=1 Tax=Coprinopsis cinerea (strain Okayama-7 / 130 / ATCC MYA-4618 / FGSC 9003) TaxID=240176 RepID=D6RMB1_COPC7|nr:hypothetical protein CC1G_14427 [Coprinopsis cinerea okayama7\|eukprot:XP_002911430.1 hypothetical protein CC1G_14427 [Coprinopsis cinerea okayama7\
MDNPQHYQPLSHALHPPLAPSQSRSPYNGAVPVFTAHEPRTDTGREEEEEEEEEQEEEDEGIVEKELNRHEGETQPSNPSSPPRPTTSSRKFRMLASSLSQNDAQGDQEDRRIGKYASRKAVAMQLLPPRDHHHIRTFIHRITYYESHGESDLCAEFYGAAEELVLANPAQLVSNPHPPPPMYPVIPGLYPPPPPGVIPTATPGASTSKQPSAIPPATVITNPQSFVVPLGGQPGFPPPQYPVYGAGQYPTSPYYPFPFSQPYYSAQPPPASTSAAPSTNTPQPPATATPPTAVPAATSAPGTSTPTNSTWSEEDVEKLKKWAEESKGTTSTGEIDWDYVTRNFGDKRSRHQVLIKATALGLKESSTRGQKRRRDNEGGDAVMGSLPTQPSGSSSSGVQPVVGSPSLSQPASTPSASPAMQHQQRPPSAPATTPSAPGNAQITMTPTPGVTTNMPWPMPTVAAPTSTGGVLGSASTSQEPQRTSYYRPRPTQGDSAPKSASQQIHHYMYVPNGRGRDTG